MKGRKCSLIFMRKVTGRLEVLEERYKDLSPKQRAAKINEEMLSTFCVGEREVERWKRIVTVMKSHADDIVGIANSKIELHPYHYEEVARVPEERQEEVIKEIQDKQLTVKETRFIVDKILAKPSPPMPNDKYRTLVIDPPWHMEKILREVRPNQEESLDYPTMSLDEIKALPIQQLAFEEGCHIYLWTTHKYLPQSFEILESWGAKYECLLTWVKNVGFTPFSWMYSTEHVLFARIGNLELLKKGERLDFQGKVREHSRKPDEFYELVKKVSPEPRLDMFSREAREGFKQYGNETTKFNVS